MDYNYEEHRNGNQAILHHLEEEKIYNTPYIFKLTYRMDYFESWEKLEEEDVKKESWEQEDAETGNSDYSLVPYMVLEAYPRRNFRDFFFSSFAVLTPNCRNALIHCAFWVTYCHTPAIIN